MMVGLDIDSHDSAWGHDPLATRNPQQPSRAEAAHKTNGVDSERMKSDGPRPQPMVGSAQEEEDDKVKQLDQQEEQINTTIQELQQ
jgi:hypothetical protein